MAEIPGALLAGLVWSAVFVLFTLCARRLTGGPGPAVLIAYPVFSAFQVVLAKSLSFVGLLSRPGFLGAYLLVIAACGAFLWLGPRRAVNPPLPADDTGKDADQLLIRRIVIGCAAAVLTGLTLFTLVTPVHIWDVLAYHMPMVASYVQNGSLDAWATQDLRQVFRVNADELQMLNVALLAGSDAWVKLPSVLGLGVVLTAALTIARLAFPRGALPYVVVALVLTAPQFVFGAATAKNDLAFTAVLLAAFYWIIRAGMSNERETFAFIALAALCGGLAAATKVMGLNVIATVGLLSVVLVWRGRLRAMHVIALAGFGIVALAGLAGDVYLANLTRTAVPVGITPDEVAFTTGLQNLTAAARFYVYELGFKRLVIHQLFEHDFMHFGYFYPFLLVFGVAGAWRQVRRKRYIFAALTVLAVVLFLSVIVVRLPIRWDQRFMIWLVPTLAILALSVGRRMEARHLLVLTASAVTLGMVNLILVLTAEGDGLFDRSVMHLAQTGDLARYVDVPNRRYLHMSDGFATLDDYATPADSLLYVGSDDAWMYLAWGPRFTRHVDGTDSPDDAAQKVTSGRYRFVVVEHLASEPIRAAVEAEAEGSDYSLLTIADGRTIYLRNALTDLPNPDPVD
jgi:hypothetical protein